MKTRQWRRSAAIVATAALGAALIGCASDGSGDSDTSTLSVPSHLWETGADAEWMGMLEAITLEQFPDLEIDKPVVPFAEYHNQVYTQMAAGTAPDVVVPYDPQLDQWARQDLLEPLNPWLEEAGIDVDAMIAAQQVAEIDGQVYGLLGFTNPRMLVVNQGLYEQAGAELATTPEEWRASAEALTDAANGVYGAAFVTGGASPVDIYQYLMPIVAGFGGVFVDEGTPTATSPEVIEALEFLKGMYNDGLVPAGVGSAEIVDAYGANKIGSVVTGPFLVGVGKDTNPDNADDYTLTQIPFANPTVSVNVFLSMPKAAKNKDAAAAFILGAVDPDVVEFVLTGKRVPPGVPVEVPASLLEEAPYLADVVAAAETAVSYAPSGVEEHANEVMSIVGDEFQNMLVNGVSASDTAQAIQDQLVDLLG